MKTLYISDKSCREN